MLIEKDVPIPVTVKTNGVDLIVPQMEVGDSVLVHGYKNRGAASLAFTGAAFRNGLPYRFTSAPEGDGFRVWRKA